MKILRLCTTLCLIVLVTWHSVAAQSDERLSQIDRFLQQHLDESPVPGFSAVVVKDDRIVFQKGYGVVVLGQDERVTEQSPIGIGSQTKSLTAVGIMRLVEQAKIELDAPVIRYLPWFSTADRRGGEITVRMLLHNTSGIKSVDRWLTSSNQSEDAAEESVRAISSVPLVRKPGASFEYANENWTILGLIISEVTGLPYSTYMQEQVLDPMGMYNSTTALRLFDDKKVLYGHYTGIEQARPARPRFLAEALAAGSELRASARDMGRYLITLLNDGKNYRGEQILTPESVDLLFTPGVRTSLYMPEMGVSGEEAGYAMGWVESVAEGRVVHQHGGDAIVMTSWTMLDREAKVGASVLYNGPSLDAYQHSSKTWLAHNLMRIVEGLPISNFGLPKEEDPTRNDYELPTELLERYTGSYMSEGGFRAQIELDEGGDSLVVTAGSLDLDYIYEVDFASESTAVLRNISGGTPARFLMTPAGKVTGIEGGLFGGLYRKLDEDVLGSLQEVRSPDGSIGLRLPASWSFSFDGNSLVAQSLKDPSARLELGFETKPWKERRQELLAASDSATPLERTETIGPWVWQELIWDQTSDSGAVQSLVASTAIGDQRFEIKLSTGPGELTDQIRNVLLPVFTHLDLISPASR